MKLKTKIEKKMYKIKYVGLNLIKDNMKQRFLYIHTHNNVPGQNAP